jgi:hypothetical protein
VEIETTSLKRELKDTKILAFIFLHKKDGLSGLRESVKAK